MREFTELRQAEALAKWWQGRRNLRRFPWRQTSESLERRAMAEGLLASTSAAMVAQFYARIFEGVRGFLDWLNLPRSEQLSRLLPLGLASLRADAVSGIASWGASPQPMTHVGAIQQFPGVGPCAEAMVLTLVGAEAVPLDSNALRVGGRASSDGDAERWMAALLGFAPVCSELLGDDLNPPLYQMANAVNDLGTGPCDVDGPDCERCPFHNWLCPTAARQAVKRCLPCERSCVGRPEEPPG